MTEGKKYGGRIAGTPNKLTSHAKDVLMEVFRELGDVPEMVAWAKDNKTSFYKLWARLLPHEVNARGFVASTTMVTKKESDREIARRLLYLLNAGLHDQKNADVLKELNMDSEPN